jgi:hypothetical protein
MALADALTPFVWGAGGAQLTPEQIARQRQIADALTSQGLDFSPVASPWQGLARVADAAVGAYKNYRSDQADKTNATTNQSLIQGLLGGGSEQFPAAPGAPTASDYADTRVKTAFGDNADEIKQGLVDRGMSPQIADAFVMNFQDESGLNPGINEKAPLVAGSRGGFGLAQWTGPRRRALEAFAADRGASPSDTGTQLDFLMSELNGPEKAAWAKIQGADTTGGAAAAIVNNFLRPAESHRAARESRYLANADPVQVASLDPSIASDLVQRPGVTGEARPLPNAPASLAGISPSDAATPVANAVPALPAPTTIQDRPVAGTSAPPQQVAQALTGQDMSRIPVTAGGNAGVYQPGQGGGMQAIVQALSSPYADDRTKQIAGMLLGNQLQQQQQANDPLRQLQIQKMQQDLSQGKLINAGNGFLYNPTSQEWITAPGANQEPDSVKALRIRAQEAGLQPGTAEYQQFMSQGGKGPLVTVNTGENSSKFVQKSDEAAAKRMDEIVQAGQTAPQTLADMQQLLDLGANIGTGKAAQAKAIIGPYAQALGINIDGMSDIQAYQAITSRLAPQMRAVGSGSSSDRDVALFFQSLPSLGNTQGGNEIIANTMKAVSQNKINAADIASKAQRGEISWQDADKQIRELPNPYDLFKQFQKETQAGKKQVIDGYTIEEVQ